MGEDFIQNTLRAAGRRFDSALSAALPTTAPLLDLWLTRVPLRTDLGSSGLTPRTFPTLLIPIWLTPVDRRTEDFDFHSDLVFSSLNGYYFIRLIDNISDSDAPRALNKLLPTAGYFAAQFQDVYQRYFPATHEFWSSFHKFWAAQAEASASDGLIDGDITPDIFDKVSSQKFVATKIPLVAALYRCQGIGLADRWLSLVDILGRLFQLANDLFDWLRDYVHGNNTFVQSEYRRSAFPGEHISEWFSRAGFSWGVTELRRLVETSVGCISLLDCPEAALWMQERKASLEKELARARAGLDAMSSLRCIFSGR